MCLPEPVSSSTDGPLNSVTELPGCSVNWEVWWTKVRVLFIPAVESQAISGSAIAEKLLLPEDLCAVFGHLCASSTWPQRLRMAHLTDGNTGMCNQQHMHVCSIILSLPFSTLLLLREIHLRRLPEVLVKRM